MIWKKGLLNRKSSIYDAIKNLEETALQIVLITDIKKNFIGTLTDGDIRMGILRGAKLNSPIERWLYLFARKSAGKQVTGWQESIQSLYEKSASLNSKDQFERTIRNILKRRNNRLFEYHIEREDTLGRNSTQRGLRFTRSKFLPTEQRRMSITYE